MYSVKYTESVKRVKSFEALNGVTRLNCAFYALKKCSRTRISILLKEFADDNFEFEENGRKLSKQVENTVGEGEIVRYEKFLLFLQCFQKACFPGTSNGVIVWEWFNLENITI